MRTLYKVDSELGKTKPFPISRVIDSGIEIVTVIFEEGYKYELVRYTNEGFPMCTEATKAILVCNYQYLQICPEKNGYIRIFIIDKPELEKYIKEEDSELFKLWNTLKSLE